MLWALLFAVGNGLMQPLELEVARAVSDRRARDDGAGPLVRRAATLGAALVGAFLVVALVLHGWLVSHLFEDHEELYVLFLVGVATFGVAHLARGTLSSHGRFWAYGNLFGVEGLARPVGVALLAVAGVTAVGAYGFMAVVAPLLGVAVALAPQRGLLRPGSDAPWNELSTKLGWLLLASLSVAAMLNAGTIAVEVLAGPGQEEAAGVFLNGLTIARVPLFLFQAVLASLLPKLSHLLGRGAYDEFATAMRRLVLALLAVGAVATVGTALVGPPIVEAVFGTTQTLGRRDMALLAAFASLFMVGGALAQALIALNDHARVAVGSVIGFGVLLVALGFGDDLYLRVETALVLSSLVVAGWMAVCLRLGVAAYHPAHEIDLAEELAELPLQP